MEVGAGRNGDGGSVRGDGRLQELELWNVDEAASNRVALWSVPLAVFAWLHSSSCISWCNLDHSSHGDGDLVWKDGEKRGVQELTWHQLDPCLTSNTLNTLQLSTTFSSLLSSSPPPSYWSRTGRHPPEQRLQTRPQSRCAFNSWTCRLAALEKQGLPLGKPRDLLLRQHMSSLGVGICLNKELSWPHPKQEGVFLPLSSFLICKCNVWKNKEIITALKMLFLLWVAGGSLGSKERIHLSWKSGRRRRSRRYEPQIIFSKV